MAGSWSCSPPLPSGDENQDADAPPLRLVETREVARSDDAPVHGDGELGVRRIQLVLAATAAGVAAAVLAAGGGVAVSLAGVPSCEHSVAQIQAGASGPLRCNNNGVPDVVAAKGTRLPLRTLSVTVASARTSRTLFIDGGNHAAGKNELWLVIDLTVANTGMAPRRFSPDKQAVLEIGDFTYTTAFVETYLPAADRFLKQTIAPGGSLSGALLFQLSPSDLHGFPNRAVLGVVNFGENASHGSVSEVGVVVMGTR
jgi:Domain of unknown function (DUF4352)